MSLKLEMRMRLAPCVSKTSARQHVLNNNIFIEQRNIDKAEGT
jgi:hypothetical protein